MSMQDTGARRAALSDSKRALLAARLRGAAPAAAARPEGVTRCAGPGPEFPASFAQERMWFLSRFAPESPMYNVPAAFLVPADVDVPALERALTEVVRRHEALRTTYRMGDDGQLVQLVQPAAPVPVEVIDVRDRIDEGVRGCGSPPLRGERAGRGPGEGAFVRSVHQLTGEEGARLFDLERGPMARLTLLRVSDAEYAMVLTTHHIATDGWSFPLLLRDLLALYDAFHAGRQPSLPDLPLRYADYAVWQRGHLQGESLQKQVRYWRDLLQGAPALDLPTDRPRPAVASNVGRAQTFRLDAQLTQRVRDACRKHAATLNMVLLATLAETLRRYSGQDDLVVGTLLGSRSRPELEPIVGMFVNSAALRLRLPADATFRDAVAVARRAVLDANQHQDLPFEKLVDELGVPRDLSRHPLFQVAYFHHASVVTEGGVSTDAQPALPLRPVDPDNAAEMVDTGAAKFDLQLATVDTGDELVAIFEYATDLFDDATIERLARHFVTLLRAAVDHLDAPLATLPMMADAERAALLAWGAGPDRGDDRTPVHRAFAAQAARTPDAVAVEGADGALTYAQLDALSASVAAALRTRGVERGQIVAVCAERSPRLVAALLGVLRTGAAYLPLDPEYPAERLAYMLEDSGTALLLTERPLSDRLEYAFLPLSRHILPGEGTEGRGLLLLDDIAPADSFDADAEVGREELAYVIYTSGSTGRPKGVMVRHGGVSSFLRSMAQAPGLRADDTLLAVTTVSFDISVLELFLPLTLGARVVLATREQAADPALLAALVARAGATVMQATPATWAMLLASGWTPRAGMRLFSGGEALPRSVAGALLGAGAELWNLYGPTETTIWSAAARVPAEGPVPLGEAIANTTLRVLDGAGDLAPVGVPGELFIGGGGVARGYLNRPGLTAEKFVPDPFAGVPGARMYRTGDRARWRADGTLAFMGRLDGQVKLRGYRIELGEIESELLRHPGVRAAAAALREDRPGDPRLVGYVVARDGAAVTGPALRAHLRERLPEYMVPSAFVELAEMPLTGSGKVDRRALPAPEGADASAGHVPPRTQTEQVLAAVWSELLGVERVGLADGFFDLGGHSLLATRLVSEVRERLGVEVSVRAVFEHPVLEAFAAEVDRLLGASDGIEVPPIVPVEHDGPVPLSFAQQRLWFIDRLEPGSPAYNMPFPLRLRGALDVPALERAMGEVVRRHDSLRTRFPAGDGAPVQRIDPAGAFHLPVDDLTTLATIAAAEAEAARRVAEWSVMPFDLEHGPLFRVRLLRLADDDHVLLGAMHHIVSDGWSMGVFWRELVTLYHAFRAGEPSPLPELPVQYADYAVWQRRWLSGERLERQVAWWREHLADAPALLELPTDRPRPALQSYRGTTHSFRIPAEVAQAVRALARRLGATPFMVFLAAFDLLMARWSGQDDVVVGTPVAGRTRRETEGLIGLFINTLPVRTDLSGDPSFAELLGRVREAALGAFAHQDVPFERLVEELQPERSLSHGPIYQVMLVLQNTPDGPAEGFGEGLRLDEAPGADAGSAKVDLTLNLADADDGSLAAVVEYAADLFDASTMERLGRHFESLLRSAVHEPDVPVSSLRMMQDAGRSAVLAMGTGAERRYGDETLHGLFARQAARTPEAAALRSEGRTMTYAELDARSSQLAHRLRRLAVGPEVRVGVCMERGMEMVAALLAVLKAGGAYVPLDPEYPRERLAYMLADAAVPVLLTQPHLRDALPAHGAQTLSIDPAFAVVDGEPREAPEDTASPAHLAYAIYTSGSTGNPKGAMNAHRGLVNRLRWMQDEYAVAAGDVVLQKTPFSFDVSVWEFFWPLITGARLVLARPGGHRDAAYLAELIEREGVTTLHFVPSMLAAFVDAAPAERCRTLTRVVCSGEALPGELVQRFYARMDAAGNHRVRLHNLYGPTEAAVDVTYWPCERGDGGPVPIGRPVANTRILVLDRRGEPVPVGVPGELHIGGVQVGRGYLGRPALTAQAFVPDPFGGPGARMYRTGDRARWKEVRECERAKARAWDGNADSHEDASTHALTHSRAHALEFLGRMDFQVKLRGFRIELGEIESHLVRHPGVSAAAAVVRDDGTGPRLAAYVVPREGASAPAAGELRAHLQQVLPEHMVPTAIAVLDALPLTGSGKVDRRALPAPDAEDAGEERVAPRSVVEEMVADIWSEVLGREQVGVTQNFFAAGGHSLLATQVIVRIGDAFGVQLPIVTFFQHPTVAGLAAAIQETGSPVLEAMVDELAGLSAEEIEALLAEESA